MNNTTNYKFNKPGYNDSVNIEDINTNFDILDKALKDMDEEYCNQRACDGQWGMLEAMACINVINEIDKIKIRGIFGRKKTKEAREKEWKKRNYKTIS